MGEAGDRVGRPVAVVPVVQGPDRPIHGDLQARGAARAEAEQHAAALVNGAVTDQPCIGSEQIGVRGHGSGQVRRARLLLAFEHEPQVERGALPLREQRVQCRQHGDDGRLVVAGRARIEPRLGVQRARSIERNVAPGAIGGLPVIVGVERERARALWPGQVGHENGWRVGLAQHLHGEAAPLEHAAQHLDVALDVRPVARDVGDREQGRELGEDGALVSRPPRPGRAGGGRGRRGARGVLSGRPRGRREGGERDDGNDSDPRKRAPPSDQCSSAVAPSCLDQASDLPPRCFARNSSTRP